MLKRAGFFLLSVIGPLIVLSRAAESLDLELLDLQFAARMVTADGRV